MLPPFSTSPLTSAPRNWPLQTASPKLSSLTFSYQLVSANGRHSKALGIRGKNQPWIFIERTDTEVEAPILWPPDSKSQLIGKDSDAGKDWRQEEKGTTEDEMAGWHQQLNGHEFERALGDGEGQESTESDTIEWRTTTNNEWCRASFHVYYPSVCHLCSNFCLSLLLTFWMCYLFFCYWAAWAAYILRRIILGQLFYLLLFSFLPFWRFFLILFIVSFTVQLSLIKSHWFIFVCGVKKCSSFVVFNGNPLQYCCLENPIDGGAW